MVKPRAALLHYSAPPVIGGVEATLAAHARLLADHGFPVKLLAGRGAAFDPRVPIELLPELDSKHPAVLAVNRQLAAGQVTADFYALSDSIRAALAQALAEVDVCIAHNVITLHKNLALTYALHALAESRSVQLIGWCHDFAWDDPVYAGDMHPGLPWDLLRTRWEGVRYVVVSESRCAQLAALLGMPASEIKVVPPGVDPREFLGLGDAAARWLAELNLLAATPLLLLPARVTRRKNIELAIAITGALRRSMPGARLLVMGPLGPHNPANAQYLEELRALARGQDAEESLVFLSALGEVDDAARRDLYLLADGLLLTSAREGFGIPVLEAGLVRLPVFCSDIPPFHESARDGALYFGLEERPETIAARLAAFFESDPRYQLKRRVLREYAWPTIFAERIEPLMELP